MKPNALLTMAVHATVSGDGAGGDEELLGAGADANVFGEVFPTDGAGAVHEELGGTGDVRGFRAGGFVQEVVTANDFRRGVGEKSKGVALRFAEMLGNGGRVNANGHHADALSGELGKLVLDAS